MSEDAILAAAEAMLRRRIEARRAWEPQAAALRRKGATERGVELAFAQYLGRRTAKWIDVGGTEVELPVAVEPVPRGPFLDATEAEADPAREVPTDEAWRRVLYERGAELGTPDGRPEVGPIARSPKRYIKVPRRAEIVDGKGVDRGRRR